MVVFHAVYVVLKVDPPIGNNIIQWAAVEGLRRAEIVP
jgi:hypothetical protein